MRDTTSELFARVKACDAELDRFRTQTALILGSTVALALTSISILVEMLF
ncbi:hypothetical protein ACETIH_03135 [Microvirga arabica]|uniref:Uncharacterized protein n=1 Tax=Microvirga arabica TaxID=1128671 RepID=A0ABV6Y366_9HYPH